MNPVETAPAKEAPVSLEGAADPSPGFRLWPAMLVLILQAVGLVVQVTPSIDNFTRFVVMMAGPLLCALLYVGWLLLASRVRLVEGVALIAIAAVMGVITSFVVHESVGVGLWIYGVPITLAVATLGLALTQTFESTSRLVLVSALLLAGWLPFWFVRLTGVTGDYYPEFAWRWAPSTEPPLAKLEGGAPAQWQAESIEWPHFRGPRMDSRAVNCDLTLDFERAKPKELWRIPIGAGWSSFAYVSGRLFTQEQRGEQELVTCYDAATGAPIWQFANPERFNEVVSGPGPRATPTFAAGRIYALGAKGLLAAVDAADGKPLWQRNVMKDYKAELPLWGFSSSPLAVGDVVIVYVGGEGDKGLVAFDRQTGEPVWSVESRGMNYTSAQLETVGGVELVLFHDDTGLMALDPTTGKVAWRYKPLDWKGHVICQPQKIGESDLIVPTGDGVGMVRLSVTRDGAEWKIDEKWSERSMRPSFNDFLIHAGHCYGFNQNIFCSIDAETGERNWLEGRYGFGQALLLPKAGQILVIGEFGELTLLAADPRGSRELGRFRLWDEKTWNHPIVVGNRLYARSGLQAVGLELVGVSAEK